MERFFENEELIRRNMIVGFFLWVNLYSEDGGFLVDEDRSER